MTTPPRTYPCPMCDGTGERLSPILGRTVLCPWCGGRRHVSQEQHQRLSSQKRAKRAREMARER